MKKHSAIDSVCEENFYKNCQLSDVSGIDFKISDVHSYDNYNYDVILANIDKNMDNIRNYFFDNINNIKNEITEIKYNNCYK